MILWRTPLQNRAIPEVSCQARRIRNTALILPGKVLMGVRNILHLYNIDMELKREFPFYYCGQRYETWGTVRGVPVILEKHPLKRKTEKCMEY